MNDKLTEVKAVNFEEFLNKMNEQTDQLDESSPDNSVELKRPSFLGMLNIFIKLNLKFNLN